MERKDIKLRVRELLRQRGMTNKALAEQMGVSPQQVTNILNGRGMSINSLLGIANALEVEFGDLFVSSYTPTMPNYDEFHATVRCPKGAFTAHSLHELYRIIEILCGKTANAKSLMKRTLERRLRFPENIDASLVSEMMMNLFLCMQPDEWTRYYKIKLVGLLPANFQIDYQYLYSIASAEDVLDFEKSLS